MKRKGVFSKNAANFCVTEYLVESDKLPKSFDGFKIAHISDLHSFAPFNLFTLIKEQHPDICVITGDLIHDSIACFDNVVVLIKNLLTIAPVYFVSGNHDLKHKELSKFLHSVTSLGAIYLDDTFSYLLKNDEKLFLCGIKDPQGIPSKDLLSSFKEKLETFLEYEDFKILLFHRANMFRCIKEYDFDLVLSGHMHGGLIRLPFLGGVLPPKTNIGETKRLFFPKYTKGLYNECNSFMIVSVGVGNPSFIPRINNKPEICTIVLKNKS